MWNFLGGLGSGLLGLFGSSRAADAAERQAEQNRQMQLQFAQNAIQWKVADAKAAGIHPLFGLGAATSSFTPVSSTAPDQMMEGFKQMGQGVERAASAIGTEGERAILTAKANLELEGLKLDNQIKQTEVASRVQRIMQPGTPPPMPTSASPGSPPGSRPNIVSGSNPGGTTIVDPFFGSVPMPPGPTADQLQKELGEMGEILPAFRFLNEWVRQQTGKPLWTPSDTRTFQRYIRPYIR